MLLGYVNLKKMDDGDKVLVRRIKHPANNGYNYSYAILIEVRGAISDSSGWIVFFNCATDSGDGEYNHDLAELYIEEFSKSGRVEVKEITVEKEIFKKFLIEKSTSTVFSAKISHEPFGKLILDIEETERKIENFVGKTKGKFLELLVYYYLTKEKEKLKFKEIEWDVKLGGKQIDVLGITQDDEVHIFECKASIGKPEERIEVIKKKIEAVEKYYKKVVPYLVVWREETPYKRSRIENSGIKIIVAKELLQNRSLSRKEVEKIRSIFEFQFKKYLSYL